MKKVVMICATTLMCFGLTGIAQAVRPVMPPTMIPVKPIKPFVSVSFKPNQLDLGTVSKRTPGSLPVKLKAHIIANCPHQVRASFAPFTQQSGRASIQPKDMSVEINGVNVPIARTAVPIIRSVRATPKEGVDVPVDVKFSVAKATRYPAGPYKGAIIFTIMAAP